MKTVYWLATMNLEKMALWTGGVTYCLLLVYLLGLVESVAALMLTLAVFVGAKAAARIAVRRKLKEAKGL